RARSTRARERQSRPGWKRCAGGSTASHVNDVLAASGKRCAGGRQLGTSEPQATASPSSRTLGEAIRRIGFSSGVLGPALYAFLAVLATAVYAPLGVSPDDVGLSYGALIARAAVLLLVVGLFAVLALLVNEL